MVMNEYDIARKKELKDLLDSKDIDSLSEDALNALTELENEMTDNKNMLVVLNESGIVGDQEFDLKIAKCFDIFLTKTTSLLGEDLCKSIYDYLPGDELGFLEGFKENRLANIANEVLNMTSNLKGLIKDSFQPDHQDQYAPILDMVELISNSSNLVAKGITEEHQLILEVRREILANIAIINEDIIPVVSSGDVSPASIRSAFVDVNDSVNNIKNHLTSVSGQINKISEG